jgi:hypothetical protein
MNTNTGIRAGVWTPADTEKWKNDLNAQGYLAWAQNKMHWFDAAGDVTPAGKKYYCSNPMMRQTSACR